MKLKAIASMCKSAKTIVVKNVVNIDGEISQWVGIGSALYRLEGLPYLNETAIYRVFDISENKTEDYGYCEETIDHTNEMHQLFSGNQNGI